MVTIPLNMVVDEIHINTLTLSHNYKAKVYMANRNYFNLHMIGSEHIRTSKNLANTSSKMIIKIE